MGTAPVRAREVEQALVGQVPTGELFRAACESCRKLEAIDDVHAPASYRQHLAAVLSRRALEKAHARLLDPSGTSALGAMMTGQYTAGPLTALQLERGGHASAAAAVGATMGETRKIALTVNGKRYEEEVEVRVTLADFLRHQLGLTGTHLGCEHGVCGACTILLDGRSARSCLMLAVQADGHEILTVEGIAPSADRAASAAAGVPRAPRPAMRLLHAGHADDADRVPARQSRPDRAGGADRDFRQSLPLHRLSEHRHRRARCGEAAASPGRAVAPEDFGHARSCPSAFAKKGVIAGIDDGGCYSTSWPFASTISATG